MSRCCTLETLAASHRETPAVGRDHAAACLPVALEEHAVDRIPGVLGGGGEERSLDETLEHGRAVAARNPTVALAEICGSAGASFGSYPKTLKCEFSPWMCHGVLLGLEVVRVGSSHAADDLVELVRGNQRGRLPPAMSTWSIDRRRPDLEIRGRQRRARRSPR